MELLHEIFFPHIYSLLALNTFPSFPEVVLLNLSKGSVLFPPFPSLNVILFDIL